MKNAILLLLYSLLFFDCQTPTKIWKEGSLQREAFLTQIPMTVKSDLIFLTVTIGGQPFNFLLDTGAPNVITTEVAESLNLKKKKYGRVEDSQGGKKTLHAVKLPPVKIGELTFLGTAALVADMRAVPIFNCLEIDGLLGANLMSKAVWQIDFPNSVIRIANEIDKLQVDTGFVLAFQEKATRTPSLSLTVGTQAISGISLDYGSVNGLTLPKSDLDSSQLDQSPIYSVGSSGIGIFGAQSDTIQYAPFSVQEFKEERIFTRLRSSDSRLLGTQILKHFRTTIDWSEGRIYLEHLSDAWQVFSSFGFSFEIMGEDLGINLVYHPSPAAKGGLAVGQQIVKINGVSVSATDYCSLAQELKDLDRISMDYMDKGQVRSVELVRRPLFSDSEKTLMAH
jgi:predicted aspartyl protease